MFKVTENNFIVQVFDTLGKAKALAEILQKANPQHKYCVEKGGIF